MSDLRERLIEAKLSGSKTGSGYAFRSNEDAADRALAEFAVWLYETATQLQQMPEDIDQTGRTVHLVKADALLALADSLTGS